VVLNAIELRDRREFRQFANLAKVVQSDELKSEVAKRLLYEDEGVRRRARWVLDLL
jgi:predicted nucleic acid-binding OB-fold protein